jgi:hypothetical protein
MTATRFAPVHNIFTGQAVSKLEVVPIPNVHSKLKGTTLHDEKFHKLMDFDQALKVPEDDFDSVRKSLQRYLDNRDLRQKVSIRQFKDSKTKSFTIWLVNEPPKVRIPRGKADAKAQ